MYRWAEFSGVIDIRTDTPTLNNLTFNLVLTNPDNLLIQAFLLKERLSYALHYALTWDVVLNSVSGRWRTRRRQGSTANSIY